MRWTGEDLGLGFSCLEHTLLKSATRARGPAKVSQDRVKLGRGAVHFLRGLCLMQAQAVWLPFAWVCRTRRWGSGADKSMKPSTKSSGPMNWVLPLGSTSLPHPPRCPPPYRQGTLR